MSAERAKPEGGPDVVLGQYLRQMRVNADLSQEQLAQEVNFLGWNGATVAKIETGTRSIKGFELLVLVEELGLDITRLPSFMVLEAVRRQSASEKAFDATRRAADTLGVTVGDIERLAASLWGRDFRRERERRLMLRRDAGRPTGRGASGRETRMMIDELRQALSSKKGKN